LDSLLCRFCSEGLVTSLFVAVCRPSEGSCHAVAASLCVPSTGRRVDMRDIVAATSLR